MVLLRIALVLFSLSVFTLPAFADTLNNDSIIAMANAGIGPETIIAKIRTSPNSYDLSTAQLIALKQRNVPDSVIAAMLTASANANVSANAAVDSGSPDPRSPHASGIYLMDEVNTPPRMIRIDANHSNQTKTSGILGYAFSYGISKIKYKTVLPNPSARIRTTAPQPSFYFYFDQSASSLSGNPIGGVWLPGAVTSPNEFSLIRFENDRGNRVATLGQFNIAGATSGVQDKARVAFHYEDVSPGVFKVMPDTSLLPGEYAFVYSATGATVMYGGSMAKIFDFAISSTDGDKDADRKR